MAPAISFPVSFHLFSQAIPAHMVMEALAYFLSFQLYLLLRRRSRVASPLGRAGVPFEQNAWILVGCVFGALAGSKLLAWIESPVDYFSAGGTPAAWIGGKTIVGGLLGGWIGVEYTKKRLGVGYSTGDLFVFPLVLGIAVGRIGCFLTGLPDHTYGTFTTLPWAVDFGDGPRHPTQLYEILFLVLLGITLAMRARNPFRNGALFRLFLGGYLAFRFAVEFIKPSWKGYGGLSAIQWASLLGTGMCTWQLWRMHRSTSGDAGIATVNAEADNNLAEVPT